MKEALKAERRSVRLRHNQSEILKDLEFLTDVAPAKRKVRAKFRRIRVKNNPLELDAILGLTSFIRDVEIEDNSQSVRLTRGAWHLVIARRIEQARHCM